MAGWGCRENQASRPFCSLGPDCAEQPPARVSLAGPCTHSLVASPLCPLLTPPECLFKSGILRRNLVIGRQQFASDSGKADARQDKVLIVASAAEIMSQDAALESGEAAAAGGLVVEEVPLGGDLYKETSNQRQAKALGGGCSKWRNSRGQGSESGSGWLLGSQRGHSGPWLGR